MDSFVLLACASFIPVNSPGFARRLLVSIVISQSTKPNLGFWAKTIFHCFFKTIMQIRFIFFIYYIPWNGWLWTIFEAFFYFFLIHTFICMLFLKTKTFSPSCTAFQIRCTATHTWHAVKSLNIGEFGNFFSGWLWTVKKKIIIFKIWPHLLLQSDLLTPTNCFCACTNWSNIM